MITGSKKQILDFIKRSGTVSLDETSEHTGLAKTTLREHMLQLERDRYIKRDYIRSGPGRPTLQYHLTPEGHSIYPTGEVKLMREFLDYLKKKGEESLIEDFFKKFWDKRYQKASGIMKEAKTENEEYKLNLLADMLEEEGFMPEFENGNDEGEITIRECNCPFREIVKTTKLPCELEAEFYQRLFNGNVKRTSYIPDDDHSCSYCITGSMTE